MSLPTPRPWPVPVPHWFWGWAGWRLNGRAGARPPAPKRIPAWAWLRLSYMKARPKAPQARKVPAPFNGKGVFLLEPTGGTEDVAAWKAAGGTYVLLNTAHVSGGTWERHRSRAKAAGLTVVPWRRCYTPSDVIALENTAVEWGSPAVAHNVETEAMTTVTPRVLADITGQYSKSRARAVVTEPWLQNDAGWHHLRDWVAMPEAFLNADGKWDPTVCCAHANSEGMPLAVPVFGWGRWKDAPRTVTPAEYLARWNGPFAVYPGDGKEHSYHQWK